MKSVALVLPLTFIIAAAFPPSAQAYCGPAQGPAYTFRIRAAESKVILFGHAENPQKILKNDWETGTTDFVIATVIRDDPILTDKKKIQLPFYVPSEVPEKPRTLLIFGTIEQGKLDFFSGERCTPAVVDYLKGLLAIDAKDRAKQLRYCFNYLEHADKEIARDAFFEFVPKFLINKPSASDAELFQVAKTLPPEKLHKWLQDEKTPQDHLAIYGFHLGHCGTEKDAALLRSLIEKLIKQESFGLLDGLLVGYVLLQPKEGWDYACTLSKTVSKTAVNINVRFSAFRMTRYFYAIRPDVISQKKVVDLYSDLMDQKDFADFPIEQLRKWKDWSLTDRILTLWKQKPLHPLLRHVIVRYALQCPRPQATTFIAELRKNDPELIVEVEQLLQWETQAAPPAGANKENP